MYQSSALPTNNAHYYRFVYIACWRHPPVSMIYLSFVHFIVIIQQQQILANGRS